MGFHDESVVRHAATPAPAAAGTPAAAPLGAAGEAAPPREPPHAEGDQHGDAHGHPDRQGHAATGLRVEDHGAGDAGAGKPGAAHRHGEPASLDHGHHHHGPGHNHTHAHGDGPALAAPGRPRPHRHQPAAPHRHVTNTPLIGARHARAAAPAFSILRLSAAERVAAAAAISLVIWLGVFWAMQ